ncbi:MAG: histidine kinase [Clostridia bacterium]|nr:histidine kinase [Clostridia bacterium]
MKEFTKKRVLEIIPIASIGALLLAFIIACAVYGGQLEKNLGRLQQGWTLSGVPYEALPAREIVAAGEETRMKIILGEEFAGAQALGFFTVYSDVSVQLNGETIYSFDKPVGEKMTKAAPSIWHIVSLPGGSSGSSLEIVLSTPYQQYANLIPDVRYGPLQQVSQYVQAETVPRFVAALAILLIGLICSIVAVILRFYIEGNNGLYSLSLFFVVLATFLASQQTTILVGMFGRSSFIIVQHVALMLCPVMYTRYLARINTGVISRLARGLYLAGVFNFLLIIALQLLHVRDMPEMMSSTRNLCAIVIIYVFILEIRQRRRILICLLTLAMIYIMYHYFFTGTITWILYVGIFAYIYILIHRVSFTLVRSQAKEIRLKAELEVSRSEIATIQITSHFFYHTLDSIRALIRMDADKAYKMTGDFAKYVRYRVDGVEGMEETVSFAKELRSIRAYTDIKQAQLGERFTMTYDVETEDFQILPLTVQPLVENAVIHAVQRRREGGEVRLVCRETDSGYHIEVIDNGPGPNAQPEVVDAQKKSTAIKNVNTRLEFYGIAPLVFQNNDLGGITAILDTPKKITRKGKTE